MATTCSGDVGINSIEFNRISSCAKLSVVNDSALEITSR